MGGFFMLFSLMILRMFPLIMLWIVKDRKKIKAIFVLSGGVILIGFFMSAVKIFQQEGWRSLVFILLGMFPHYLCYGFSFWILLRCIWYAWSDRVWKRIRLVSGITIFAGVFIEFYWNAKILQNFFGFFKFF